MRNLLLILILFLSTVVSYGGKIASIITETDSVYNTTDEEVLFTSIIRANSVNVGQMIEMRGSGSYDVDDASNYVTLRVKMGETVLATLVTEMKVTDNGAWFFHLFMTVRKIGESGEMAILISGKGEDMDTIGEEVTAFNTTVDNTVTLTVQWNVADVNDVIRIIQGYVIFKN